MIKEIEEPLETIQLYLARIKASRKVKRDLGTKLTEYDVHFKEDKSLIEEFAKRCNIDNALAERIATFFFEEIKKGMLGGCVVQIYFLGKFFLNGPHLNSKGKIVLPNETSWCFPRFKASVIFKRYILNQNK